MSGPSSGADLLVQVLAQSGIPMVFGVPGTQTVPLFEALRASPVRSVLATSELAASFMAGGLARVTGRPGVLITIPGPGFTWALTGIAEARLDSIPLLHICGAPPATPGRRYRQQEIDQPAVAAALTKATLRASEAGGIPDLVRQGLQLAQAGEPGPVLLEVPTELLNREAVLAGAPGRSETPRPFDLEALVQRFKVSRRPVLFAGQALTDSETLLRLAETLQAPVITTPSGRGAVPEDHRLAMGFDGLRSDPAALNRLFETADLILVLGAKLGHNGTCGFSLRLPVNKLIRVDTSGEVLAANYPASLSLEADVGTLLRELVHAPLGASGWTADEVSQWRIRLRAPGSRGPEPRIAGQAPERFFATLRRVLPRDAIVVLDSGMHQILARRHYDVYSPRGLLFPSDLQSMGFCLPTAIGARLGAPGRPVVALLGDGGFSMTGLELLTAVREGLELVVLVMVDGQLGQIRMQQLAEYGQSHAVKLQNPDFELLAQAVGAGYAYAGDGIDSVLPLALARGGVTLIEVPVGDTLGIQRQAAVARIRGAVRRAAGPRAIRWLKRLLGRDGNA